MYLSEANAVTRALYYSRLPYALLWLYNRRSAVGWALWWVLLTYALVVGGYLYGTHNAGQPGICHFEGGGTLASGDAAYTTDGREYVCTSGTLVPVRGYGQG